MEDSAEIAAALDGVGPRLKLVRARRALSLSAVSELTGNHDVVLGQGEVAEFDTRVPHWFGSTGEQPAEILSLFGPQGESMHVRATSRRTARD